MRVPSRPDRLAYALALAWLGSGCALMPVRLAPLSAATLSETGIIVRYDPSGLPTVRLRAGDGTLTAEIASTRIQRTSGLASRASLPEDRGMLFVNQTPQLVVYNSRDTLIPLSSAYIDQDGTILEIHHMQPNDLSPVISRSDRIKFVLEVNRGWFERHRVTVGSRLQVANR